MLISPECYTVLQSNHLRNQHLLLSNDQNSFGMLLELISKLLRSQTKKISLVISSGTPVKCYFRAVLGVHMLECLRGVKGWTNPSLSVPYGKWFKIPFYIKISKDLLWNRIPYTHKCLRKNQEFKNNVSELPQATLY